MLRVLTLSTLFPDAARPNFGVFVERQTLELAKQPDTEVRVVAPIGLPPFPLSMLSSYRRFAGLPRYEMWKGVPVHRPHFLAIPGIDGRRHPLQLAKAITPLLEHIRREFPFDVIDASFFFPDGPVATDMGARFGVPVSVKARGADIHYWGNRLATAGFIRRAGADADGLLAVSDAMRSDMIALGMPAERIRVHHTGVDQARFAPDARTASADSQPHVLSLGALIPRKGHDVVIEAVSRLSGVRLDIIGEGPERQRLTDLVERLGLCNRVRLLGSIAHQDLPAMLANADVMALASASEGLANAWVEALACGTPIVITEAGGAREVVDRSEAGRIVERTGEAFAAGIGELLAMRPDRAAVRATATRFTWERNASTLRAHLAALVEARR